MPLDEPKLTKKQPSRRLFKKKKIGFLVLPLMFGTGNIRYLELLLLIGVLGIHTYVDLYRIHSFFYNSNFFFPKPTEKPVLDFFSSKFNKNFKLLLTPQEKLKFAHLEPKLINYQVSLL